MKTAYKWLPVFPEYCLGCGKCVETCPADCIEMVWDFATLPRPDACVSEGDCLEVCPQEGIRMEWLKTTGDPEVGHWCKEPPKPSQSRPKSWLWNLWGSARSLLNFDRGRGAPPV